MIRHVGFCGHGMARSRSLDGLLEGGTLKGRLFPHGYGAKGLKEIKRFREGNGDAFHGRCVGWMVGWLVRVVFPVVVGLKNV